jgi:hypothetical protein
MPEHKPSRPFLHAPLIAPMTLVLPGMLVVIAACAQAFDYPFVSDDTVYIVHNAKLAGLRLAELWRLLVEPYNDFEFLPLRDLSYWLDLALSGPVPFTFRLHNLILYLLCLPLVYVTTAGLYRYFLPADAAGTPWASATVTALFALHPAHIEGVVWVSGRKDVLAALLSLFALWLALLSRRERGLAAPQAATALAALLAAVFSKGAAVAVAAVIALLWLCFWLHTPAADRRRSMLLWPLACLLLAACAALVFAANNAVKAPSYFGSETIIRALAALGWLARLALSLEDRHYFYPVFEDAGFPAMAAAGAAVLAGAAVGGVMMLRGRSLAGFAWLSFALLCLPYTQIVPYKTFSLVSDRFAFLAAWPAMLLVTLLAWRLMLPLRAALLLALALLFAFQTVSRPRDWRSYETLIDADMKAYPGHYVPAYQKISAVQLPQGLNKSAGETAGSITDPEIRNLLTRLIHADYAVRVRTAAAANPYPALAPLHELELALEHMPAQGKWNTSLSWIWAGCRADLAAQWNYLARRFPDNAAVRYDAGSWMAKIHDYKNAIVHLRAAVESPQLPESARGRAYRNLGLALLGSGSAAEAEAPLRAALEQRPPDAQAHCLLSEVYKQTGRREEAVRAADDCLRSAPGNPNRH